MRISIEQAAELLLSGKIVAVPTETVYGLAAALSLPGAIEEIFKLKGRPCSNPLIVHLANVGMIEAFIRYAPKGFFELTKAFWPGPMTLVLEAKVENVPSIVRAGLPTVAFRVPQHPLARKLIEVTGPLVMPSANLSGTPSSTNPIHVESDFGKDFPVLDGESSIVGLESTILISIDNEWQIIRQGALSSGVFKEVLDYEPKIRSANQKEAPLCPGQLFRHYAPKAHLILEKNFLRVKDSIILGYSDRYYPSSNQIMYLGESTDPSMIANRLYSTLRLLDQNKVAQAHLDIDLPNGGLYATLLERMSRAAEAS